MLNLTLFSVSIFHIYFSRLAKSNKFLKIQLSDDFTFTTKFYLMKKVNLLQIEKNDAIEKDNQKATNNDYLTMAEINQGFY